MERNLSWLKGLLLCLLLAWPAPLPAQAPPVRDAAELQQILDQLQVVGSVLYLAAHPDDENNALLAYFSKGRHLSTSYLSLNRGGGGQNRIGTEQGDLLAALRTQELLAARRLDGAEQYFSRAVDFGYSKTPEATLAIWGHDTVLADVVWTIRKLRPDVIVTRFSPTRGGTHGHHTASAILAQEAFQAAADPARFPEQLAWVKPWQATRLVWNSYRLPNEWHAMAPGSYLSLEVGGYDPLLGMSYPELGAASRSQHRSQAFGTIAQRGPRTELFETLAGQPPRTDLFDGIDLTWSRVPGAAEAASWLVRARQAYRPERPAGILPMLLKAKAALDRLPAEPRVVDKRAQLLEAIRCAAGIWVEAVADRQTVAPGDPLEVTATILARNDSGAALTGYAMTPALAHRAAQEALPVNEPVRATFKVTFPAGTPCSQPYWMGRGLSAGLHPGGPPELAGLPENPPALAVTFQLVAGGVPFELTAPVRYRVGDQVLGERYQPLAVMPPVLVNFDQPVEVLAGGGSRQIGLVAVAGKAQAAGRLKFQVSGGWRVEPAELRFALAKPGDEARFSATLIPPAAANTGALTVLAETGGGAESARSVVRIDYPHIPLQTLFPPAAVKLVRLDLKQGGRRIGYVTGAGDQIPALLRPLGYRVDLLDDEDLAAADLSVYDAIVVGIRAFNVRPALARLNPRLLDYVAGGGTEIVLYSVDQGLVTQAIGPFPFRISSHRVTDPAAAMVPLAPHHALLNQPNRITPEDFQGWVQERGTYFAEDWDARFVPIFSVRDPGELPDSGSLIVAAHGKGRFIYTGLGFFRQLPAGVPGAYRLFANLLALGRP
ncbi:MAG: PIG-L family deacetylase [Holophaga sp.]|nr:PIG-L family deacetylase [Holophaga sp.]